MNTYVASGSSSTHQVDFTYNGELIVPTSATYSLLDGSEDIVAGLEDEEITLEETTTSVSISILSGANTPTVDNAIRYLVVKFTYNGNVYTKEVPYLLRTSVRLPITIDSVKACLGFTAQDIPDDLIDLTAGYDLVVEDLPDLDVRDLMTSGGTKAAKVIEAIKYRTALATAGTLEVSLMQSEQSDNTVYKRFAGVDFSALRKNLQVKYLAAVAVISEATSSTGTVPIYSIMAVGTDPVTNT